MSVYANPGLAGNPHFIDVQSFTEPHEQQVSATLALAYEQRTASLLALWQNPTTSTPTSELGLTEARLMALQQEILERLGSVR